jgi:hypothetical protein
MMTSLNLFFIHKGLGLEIQRMEFVEDRISFTILKGCWCNNVILNILVPVRNKCNDPNDFNMRLLCCNTCIDYGMTSHPVQISLMYI